MTESALENVAIACARECVRQQVVYNWFRGTLGAPVPLPDFDF
jgi:hypothetical protein